MENSEIIWTGSPDDQIARSGEYVLTAHEAYKGSWKWHVYFKGFQVAMIMTMNPQSEEAAKAAAINAMKEHLKTCKD